MHELSICQALIRAAESAARERGAMAIRCVHVRVGPLSGVEPKLLNPAWKAATPATSLAGAALSVECSPLLVRCRECNALSRAQPGDLRCERCGSGSTLLESGDECLLVGLDLLMPEPEHPAVPASSAAEN